MSEPLDDDLPEDQAVQAQSKTKLGEQVKVDDNSPPKYKHRYTVGIFTRGPLYNYYQDVFEFNVFKEAENKCIDHSCDEDTECIVYDREHHCGNPIVFRHGAKQEIKEDVKRSNQEPEPATGKKSKPRKIKR